MVKGALSMVAEPETVNFSTWGLLAFEKAERGHVGCRELTGTPPPYIYNLTSVLWLPLLQ